jgi:hypothetical protein
MRTHHYARSGRRWAHGAELVYGPIAAELVGFLASTRASTPVSPRGTIRRMPQPG